MTPCRSQLLQVCNALFEFLTRSLFVIPPCQYAALRELRQHSADRTACKVGGIHKHRAGAGRPRLLSDEQMGELSVIVGGRRKCGGSPIFLAAAMFPCTLAAHIAVRPRGSKSGSKTRPDWDRSDACPPISATPTPTCRRRSHSSWRRPDDSTGKLKVPVEPGREHLARAIHWAWY